VRILRLLSFPVLLVAAASCAAARSPSTPSAAGGGIEAEARAFMASYARDLVAGDREGIARRYHPGGAYRLGMGSAAFEPFDSIAAGYRGERWGPPSAFRFCGLAYEPVGGDAVAVVGRFEWTSRSGRLVPATYTALLVRHGGALVIRIEDEDIAPADAPALPCTDPVAG
jgi:hypothetical protein